ISDRFAYCRLTEIRRRVKALHGARGVRALREAVALIRPGTDSAMETRARLLFIDSGLPEPEVNFPLYDPATGRWMVQPDLGYRRWRLAFEYDGSHHRTD